MPPEPAPQPGHDAQLTGRSIRGASAMLGSSGVQMLAGLVGTAVLARLIDVDAFGLMALALTPFALAGAVADFGLPHAITHHDELDPASASALFRLNRTLTLTLTIVLAATGPIMAWAFDRGELVPLIVVLSLVIGGGNLFNLHVGYLRREMRFGLIAAAEGAASLLSIAAAAVAAVAGLGVWALVVQLAVQKLGSRGWMWLRSGWRPSRVDSRGVPMTETVRSVRRYATHVAIARFIANLGRNCDRLVVGKVAGVFALGLYDKAFKWSVVPIQQVHQPLLSVATSSLSKLQRTDVPRYRRAVRRALLALLSVTMPASVLLMLEARLLTLLLLGRDWLGAVPVFRILGVAALATGISQSFKWIFLGEGLTGRQITWSTLSSVVTIAGVGGGAWAALRYGYPAEQGVAAGFAVASLVTLPAGIAFCTRGAKVSAGDLLAPTWRPTCASLIAGVIAAAFVPNLVWPAQGLSFALLYVATWLALPGRRGALDDLNQFRLNARRN